MLADGTVCSAIAAEMVAAGTFSICDEVAAQFAARPPQSLRVADRFTHRTVRSLPLPQRREPPTIWTEQSGPDQQCEV